MSLTLFSRKSNRRRVETSRRKRVSSTGRPATDYEPADVERLEEAPLERYLQLERFGVIVNQSQRWSEHPEAERAYRAAAEAIDEQFCLVPEGFVSIPQMVNDFPGCAEVNVETDAFLLARQAVTNAQFQKFVDSGGYEDLELWPKDIWPHLVDFKDQTGETGPRFWRQRRHDKRLADHPVVGISFYEASAYTRWAGFRLPTEAQWQMAASWRIRSSAHVMRRYPWGDALDIRHCNIWGSGLGRTAPVDAFPTGAAPNGVLQLIGNVWEWTGSDFEVLYDEGRPVVGDMLMKSIRGGAFDTYFVSQATSNFRTGVVSLARAHNVGFRCALDISGRSSKRSAS